MFASTLKLLEETMESIRPSIMRIETFNRDLDRPDEIKRLQDLMRRGEELVLKCAKIHRYNYVKKPLYTKKLVKLDESIRRYIETILPLHQTSDVKETLFEMRILSSQIRNLSMGGASSAGVSSAGVSNKSGFVGVCSPPGLKVVPVGLEIPLKELKEKLLKDDKASQVTVVSAPGGCGKTTLVTALCQDADVKGTCLFHILVDYPFLNLLFLAVIFFFKV